MASLQMIRFDTVQDALDARSRLPARTCGAIHHHGGEGAARMCVEPAPVRIRAGCVHEHVFTARVCTHHAADAKHCLHCAQGPDPHVCDLMVHPAPLEAM
jgi:hypothetical protein